MSDRTEIFEIVPRVNIEMLSDLFEASGREFCVGDVGPGYIGIVVVTVKLPVDVSVAAILRAKTIRKGQSDCGNVADYKTLASKTGTIIRWTATESRNCACTCKATENIVVR